MRPQTAGRGFASAAEKRSGFCMRVNSTASATRPNSEAMVVARPAPAVPSGAPVPQPLISTGARAAFSARLSDWMTIGARRRRPPRSAEPMAAAGNISATDGRKAIR